MVSISGDPSSQSTVRTQRIPGMQAGSFLIFPTEFTLGTDEAVIMGVMFQPETAGHFTHVAAVNLPDGSQQLLELKGHGVTISFELLNTQGSRQLSPAAFPPGVDRPFPAAAADDPQQPLAAGRPVEMWMGEVTVGVTVEGQHYVSNHGPLPLPFEWVLEEVSVRSPAAARSPAQLMSGACAASACGSSSGCADASLASAASDDSSQASSSGTCSAGDDRSDQVVECPFEVLPDWGELAPAATTRFSFTCRPTRPGRWATFSACTSSVGL